MNADRPETNRKVLILTVAAMVSVLALCVFWFTEFILTHASEPEPADGELPQTSDNTQAPDPGEVFVSHSSGFYESGILLEMYPPEDCEIYYTVTMATGRSIADGRIAETGEPYMFIGGKDPLLKDLDQEPRDSYDIYLFNSSDGRLKTYKYSQPLDLFNPGNFSSLVVSVKAQVYKNGVRQGPINHFTYILGSAKGDKTFEDIYGSMVISITADDTLLYDYERGIFISGAKYDEAIRNGVQLDPWTPRNYNQRGAEWERLAYVDFFETDGRLVLSTVCGIRVAGGTSRGAQIKSLKLVAGTQYDGHDRFEYPFFEGGRDCDGNLITSYKKLVLRNARNDIGGTMVRDQLLHKLGGLAGVDYQEGRNAVVYFNGKYYALMCLHESLDAEYFEDHYFVNKNNIASFLIKSDQYQFRYKQESGTEEQFKCFLSDMDYLIYNDFSDEGGFERISKVVDVDNFCQYMAYQIFIVNEDWPHNNVLVWRYYGPENSSVKAMDGRWRFVLKDLDFGLVDPARETFSMCLNDSLYGGEPCVGPALRSAVKNPEFREHFRRACIDVTETLTTEVLLEQINNAVDEISGDMELFSLYNGMSMDGWRSYFDLWRTFAKERHGYYLKYLDQLLPSLIE